jgi:hypothetical protein
MLLVVADGASGVEDGVPQPARPNNSVMISRWLQRK